MFAAYLKEAGINYRILGCNENGCALLINKGDYIRLKKVLSKNGYRRIYKQESIMTGFIYRYSMHEIMFFSDGRNDIDVYFEVPCFSLTQNQMIPLHQDIQHYFWNHSKEENGKLYVDDRSRLLLILVTCIFKKKMFEENDIDKLNDLCYLLDDETFKNMLGKVFFGYTERLITKLKNNEMDDVCNDYLSFSNY